MQSADWDETIERIRHAVFLEGAMLSAELENNKDGALLLAQMTQASALVAIAQCLTRIEVELEGSN